MKFLNTAKKAAAHFCEDTIIEYSEPPIADAVVSELPEGWQPTDRVTRGKPVYVVYAIFKKINPVLDILMALPREVGEHIENGVCPHCQGRGRYSAHLGHFHNDKCYRCDGKGLLDAKDLAFLKRREVNAEPICHIVTA